MVWYWAGYLLIGFGVPETYALVSRHPEWTLSDTVWRWCNTSRGSTLAHWTAVHVFAAMFLTWLWFHLVLGWWSGVHHR